MGKYELKTKLNDGDVHKFLNSVKDAQKREDSKKLLKIFEQETGEKAKMWGSAIVGFGSYHYKYAPGQVGDWPLAGFSPRVQNLTLYLSTGFEQYADFYGYDPEPLLKKLGKHTTGKVCLYIKHLSDVDEKVLRQLIRESTKQLRQRQDKNKWLFLVFDHLHQAKNIALWVLAVAPAHNLVWSKVHIG